jgi:hypothetical protein
MHKNTFIYENELKQLQKEFESLHEPNGPTESTEPTEFIQSTESIQSTTPTLNVSKDNTTAIHIMIDRLTKYAEKNKPTLAILTPCYGGLSHTNYTMSLINTIQIFESCNFPTIPFFLNNDSLVSRARNNLVGCAMLNESITHFIFIDSDIAWNPIDIIKLVLSDEMIIGGLYPKKNYKFNKITSDPSIITRWIDKKNQLSPNTSDEMIIRNNLLDYNLNYISTNLEIKNNIIEVKHLATGFMMFKRKVIEMMEEKFSETKYIDDTGFISKENSIHTFALFDCGVINQSYYSEDWMFCHRWSSIGGKIYADISIDLVHIGVENYSGSFIKNLLTK